MFKSTLFSFVLLAFLACASTPARAIDIYDGWYWNPSESGWGMQVEVQAQTMTVALYTYNEDGTRAWYVGSGHFDYGAKPPTFQADLKATQNGACFSCVYTGAPKASSAGTVTIKFHSLSDVEITWHGETKTLQRFHWAYAVPADMLFGTWVMVRGVPGGSTDPVAEFYTLDQVFTLNDGSPAVSGSESDGSLTYGYYNEEQVTYVVIDVSKSNPKTYISYWFVMTKGGMTGNAYIVQDGNNTTPDGIPFYGFRIGQQDIKSRSSGTASVKPVGLKDLSLH